VSVSRETVAHAGGRYCSCPRCLEVKRRGAKLLRQRVAAGQSVWGDMDAVREHLGLLRQAGMGVRQIAEQAQVGQSTIARMLWTFKGVGHSEKVTAQVAARILSVRLDVRKLSPGTVVDSTGARRRLQALLVAGSGTRCWTIPLLAEKLGIDRQRLLKYTWMPRFSAGLCVRFLDLFEELWLTEPPEVGRFSTTRTLNMARRKGWVGIGAWDDNTIDDPNAQPNLRGDQEGSAVDSVKIARVRNGNEKFKILNPSERIEMIRDWVAEGGTKTAFETKFNVSTRTSTKYFALAVPDYQRKSA